MSFEYARTETWPEALRVELTDASLTVARRHGVHGSLASQRTHLGKALDDAIGKQKLQRAEKADVGTRAWREALIAEVTEAVYQVVLECGFQGSFLDLELDLWKNLCQALRQSALARHLFRSA